jgi:phosphoglycolate phosphatase
MKGNYDSLILDVDGTLWDSTGIVAEAWTKAIKEEGGMELEITADRLKKLFGKTMDVIADLLLPEVESQRRYQIMDACCAQEHQALKENLCNICYSGVISTIKEISKRKPVFIVSNCQSGYIELFLEKTNLGDYVTDIECFGNTGKTKGENIHMLVERNELKKPVYVGDTLGDFEAAKAAGIPFIFAEYGFGQVEDAEISIKEFEELKELLIGEHL